MHIVIGLTADNGVLETVDATKYRFTPNPDFSGTVTSTMLFQTKRCKYLCYNTITLSANADAPVLGKLSGTGLLLAEINEDTSRTITRAELLAFYQDTDGDTLTIVNGSLSSPNGTITASGNDFIFTPTANFSGSTQIDFKITDSAGHTIDAAKFINVKAVNDAPTITLPRKIDAAKDYSIKTYLYTQAELFGTTVPTNPVVAIDTTNGDVGVKVELVSGTTSYRVTVPANVATPIDLTLRSDNLTNSTFNIQGDHPRKLMLMSAGFERFFSLSDFGYSDIESTPINSVIITIPDPNVGYLMLAQTGFEIDGATNLTTRSTLLLVQLS